MSLRVKHLNADSSFLLIFSPPCAPHNPQGTFPGSFTIILDPWLSGPSTVWNSKFALTTHVIDSCVETLAELPDPDLVIISQDKPDHCHQETLIQLPADTAATILGTPGAAKKIRGWKHFDPLHVQALRRYDERQEDTVHRIPIPAYSTRGSAGEVTVTLMVSKRDLTGLHNAIGITYRPPSSVLSGNTSSYVNLPLTPPTTPPSGQRPTTPIYESRTVYGSPLANKEKTLSVIYCPHGVNYNLVKPWASSHLLAESALPLTALLHSFDRLSNPWYLGGNVSAGSPGGLEIARNLFAKAWISAHDEDKISTGLAVMNLKTVKFERDEIRGMLQSSGRDSVRSNNSSKARNHTAVVELEAGEEYFTGVR